MSSSLVDHNANDEFETDEEQEQELEKHAELDQKPLYS